MKSTADEPMTMGERYSSAIESSNLRMKETRSDLDLIIAAATSESNLASGLMRLLVEFDLVRGDYRAAELQMRQKEAKAKRQERKGWIGGESPEDRSNRILAEAEAAALTAHVLIRSQLSSLRDVKAMFAQFATVEATRRRFMQPDGHVIRLAGQVLDVYISPTCRHCAGRGFHGSIQHGEKQTICRPCRGSGNRRDSIGKDNADRSFANHLLMTVSALVDKAEAQMSGKRRRIADWKALIQDAESGEIFTRTQ